MLASFKKCLRDKHWINSTVLAFLFLALSIVINFYASTYATAEISNPVTDIVLSNIPVINVDLAFEYGTVIFVACIFIAGLTNPKRIPFILKSISLFVVIRAIFISLTHLAPFPSHVAIKPLEILEHFTFGGDLFFSGHTGLPFLMALIFWDSKTIRTSFFSFAVIFAAITLMGHLHYSIDVLAAFFITYSIYRIAEKIFKNDKQMADSVMAKDVKAEVTISV